MNRPRPQSLESIYEELANSGDVGGEHNRNDENKVYIIKRDIKSWVLLVADELLREERKPV